MKKAILLVLCIAALTIGCSKKQHGSSQIGPVIQHSPESRLPVWDEHYQTAIAEPYDSGNADDKELDGVQCPIPMDCRVRNHTGSQCVFASLECLARWAECKKLLEPQPLTSRPGCRSYSSPPDAASKLRGFGVRFEDSTRDREKGIALIKKAMKDGRGCLWGVPGHAMVLCHYDEAADVVKWIDNSDRSLRIQTTTVARFKQRWDTWIIALYAEPDLFPDKALRVTLPNLIPIIDRNNPQGQYDKKYIPRPIIK